MESINGNCVGNGNGEKEYDHDEKDDALGKSRLLHDNVKAKMPVERNATHYNFNHKNRGVAIIFNHEVFEVENFAAPPRSGTNLDLEYLTSCLNKLGFDVHVYHNLEYRELRAQVISAARLDHTDNDCFVMCFLTHGKFGYLYAKDTAYEAEELWLHFAADTCPTLAGKPKMIFIQACQGNNTFSGVTLNNRTETDGRPPGPYNSYVIPTQADFLIAYSIIPGYYSWRDPARRSCFIEALCRELEENSYVHHLLTILTFVARRVAIDYESNTPNKLEMHRKKELPCVTSMLTRLVKFNVKGRSDLANQVVVQDVKMNQIPKNGFFRFVRRSYQVNY